MAELVNLGRARKQAKKIKKRQQGTVNAAVSGLSSLEKKAASKAREKARRHLDGHKVGADD